MATIGSIRKNNGKSATDKFPEEIIRDMAEVVKQQTSNKYVRNFSLKKEACLARVMSYCERHNLSADELYQLGYEYYLTHKNAAI